MRTLWVLFVAISLSLFVLAQQGYLAVMRNSQGQESQITTLIHKIPYTHESSSITLRPTEKVHFTFDARYNNLGTVAIKLDNPLFRQETEAKVVFRIKEKASDHWSYQQEYLLKQISPDQFYPFGFPAFLSSRGGTYLIEIEYLGAKSSPVIALDQDARNVIAKYDYPKPYLLSHNQEIPRFVFYRVISILSYIPRSEIGRLLFVSILPLLISLYFLIPKMFARYKKWTPWIIFAVTFAVAGYFSSINIDPHHDGIMLKPAIDVARGKVLFKETFAQYGALTVLLQATAIKLFGEYLLTIKLLTAFFYALSGVTLYAISKKILPSFLVIPTFVIWLFMAPYYTWIFLPWSSVYALFFQLASAYFLLTFLETKQRGHLIVGSMLTGLIFWVRQPVGMFTVLALLAYFVFLYATRQITRKILVAYLVTFVLSIVGVSLVFVGSIALFSSISDWYKQSIELAYWFAKSTGGGFDLAFIFRSLLPTGWSPIPVWTFIPLASLILLISHYKDRRVTIMIFVGLASWMQYYPVSCIRHQYWGATPLMPLFVLFVYTFVRTYFASHTWSKRVVNMVTFLFLGVIFFPEMGYRALQGMTKFVTSYEHVDSPRVLRGMQLAQVEASFVASMSTHIESYLDQHAEANLITTSPHALYLTFDGRIRNIHPMYVSWKLVNDTVYPGYTEMMSSYMDREQPLVVHLAGEIPQGYCPVPIVNDYDDIRLAAPCK